MRILRVLAVLVLTCLFPGCSDNTVNTGTEGISWEESLHVENIFPLQAEHCHASTIVELPNNDLLVAWFQGSGERTADDVSIKGARYNHKTGSWTEPFNMANVPNFPDINPVLFIDGEGILWMVWYTVMAYQWESSLLKFRYSRNYQQKDGPPEWDWQDMLYVKPDGSVPNGIGQNDAFVKLLERKYGEYYDYLTASGQIKDSGNIWLTRKLWENSIESYMNIAKGTNLMRNGIDYNERGRQFRTRLGYPLMRRIGWQTRNKPLISGNRIMLPLYSDGFDFSLVAITENRGKNWTFSEPIVGAGNVQPSFALCQDGSIVAYMRDNGPPPNRLMKSVSTDSCLTWSTVEDTEIPNPGSAADIVRLKNGNWILASNDLDEGRQRLSVWLSKDEGKTWPYKKAIVSGPEEGLVRAHYPAIIQGSDGTIHITYTFQLPDESGKGSVKNIAHATFSEKWLMQ